MLAADPATDPATLWDAAAQDRLAIRDEAIEEGDDPDLRTASDGQRRTDAAVAEVEWDRATGERPRGGRGLRPGRCAEAVGPVQGPDRRLHRGAGRRSWRLAVHEHRHRPVRGDRRVRRRVRRRPAGVRRRLPVRGQRSRSDWVGIQAFNREYARSRGLERQKLARFHHDHRDLPVPGAAESVQAGPIPGTSLDGLFVMIADSAELRASGRHGMEARADGGPALLRRRCVAKLPAAPSPEAIAALRASRGLVGRRGPASAASSSRARSPATSPGPPPAATSSANAAGALIAELTR